VAFLVREGRAVRRPVETGARRRGVVEILSGVAAGDTVVVAGQQNLRDGAGVRVTVEEHATLPGQAVGDRGSDAEAPAADTGSGTEGSGADGEG
jgi:hypothetical protein